MCRFVSQGGIDDAKEEGDALAALGMLFGALVADNNVVLSKDLLFGTAVTP